MKKTLIIFKTHFLSDYVLTEYLKVASGRPENSDIVLYIDNHKKWFDLGSTSAKTVFTFNNQQINCFLYDENMNSELMLPNYVENGFTNDIGSVIWHNSDYPFYVTKKYFPDYDYYWSFEYDVFFNGKNYRPFFDKYNNRNEDLLSTLYRNVDNEDWFWKDGIDWVYSDINLYGILFPAVRLSSKAIDWLLQKRLEYAEIYKNLTQPYINKSRWLFCEIFVPTELANRGFSCANIEEENVRYLPIYNLNTQRIFENPDDKLYHPVK